MFKRERDLRNFIRLLNAINTVFRARLRYSIPCAGICLPKNIRHRATQVLGAVGLSRLFDVRYTALHHILDHRFKLFENDPI